MQSTGKLAGVSSAPVRASAPPRFSRRRKLAYTGVCVVVLLLFLEGAVRIRAWVRYGTAAAGVTTGMIAEDAATGLSIPRAGYELVSDRISIKINSLGFRGDEIERIKSPNTLRIACVGASTTFCAEASDNGSTWPALLERRLQQELPQLNVEVINAGIPGYIASESRKNFELRVLPLEPDLVIYYEANNDIAYDTLDLARRRGLVASSATHRSDTVKILAKYSLLFDLVHKNSKMIFAKADRSVGRLDDLPEDLPVRFVGELEKLHELLKGRGIPLVLSTYLVKYRRSQDRSTQIANADIAFFYMPWMTIDDLLDAMDSYNNAIVSFARSRGLPVVEDRETIPADAVHFADCVHLRDAGCAKMAERFSSFLLESGVLASLAIDAARPREETVVDPRPEPEPVAATHRVPGKTTAEN